MQSNLPLDSFVSPTWYCLVRLTNPCVGIVFDLLGMLVCTRRKLRTSSLPPPLPSFLPPPLPSFLPPPLPSPSLLPSFSQSSATQKPGTTGWTCFQRLRPPIHCNGSDGKGMIYKYYIVCALHISDGKKSGRKSGLLRDSNPRLSALYADALPTELKSPASRQSR